MFHWSTRALFVAGLSLLAMVPPLAQQASSEPPPGPGLDLIQRSCISCHDIYMITSKRKTADEWATTLDVMASRGAEISPDEMQIIEKYLTEHFAPEHP